MDALRGNYMDKLVKDLLNIEHVAKESLKELEEEHAALAQRISDETARRISEIKLKTDRRIQDMKQEAGADLKLELAEIENQHQQKAARLMELFDANMAMWRKEWGHRVLQRSLA